MSPLERDQDRQAEQEVAEAVASIWNCQMVRLGEFDRVDYYAVRGEQVRAACEVKCRKNGLHKYPTVYLALRKWQALVLTGMAFGIAPFFIVQWTDALGYVNVLDVPPRELRLVGRFDRGLDNDREPCAEVPVELFTMLTKGA